MGFIHWLFPGVALLVLIAAPVAAARPAPEDQERPARRAPADELRTEAKDEDDEAADDAGEMDDANEPEQDADADPDDDPPDADGDADDAEGVAEKPLADPKVSIKRLSDAVEDLREEYADAKQSKGGIALREQSTFFLDQPERLDPRAVVLALEKPLGNDPRLTAYVKWQLLSAAPEGGWDSGLVPRVAEVYRRAPLPVMRFGASAADQRKLDGLLTGSKKEDGPGLNDKLDEAVEQNVEANRVIFAYRDALYASLPPGYDKFFAGLRDATERLEMGWQPKDFMKQVVADASAWAASGDADPKQCAVLAKLVYRLRSQRGPKYYAGVATRRTGGQLYWSYRTEALYDAKKLGALQKALEAQSNSRRPPGRAGN